IKVDRVVQGKDISNMGNVARRFFQQSDKTSQMTGLDANLLQRFHVILTVSSFGYDINYAEFDTYAKETAECMRN
ncbi:hypothetical protein ILUMI_17228, partial [Ignelater luminosus]